MAYYKNSQVDLLIPKPLTLNYNLSTYNHVHKGYIIYTITLTYIFIKNNF